MRNIPCFVTFAILGGCATRVTMEEFTVIAVRADQLSEYVGSLRAGKEAALSPDGFLLVRVKTVEDLSEIARESSVILDAKVRFCEKSKTVHRLNVSGISYSGQPLLDDLENGKTSIPATQNRTYDILLYVSLKENAFEREFNPNLSHLGHDLHRDAKDICISIRGGNLDRIVSSNTIRIDKEAIRDALRN